MKVDSRDLAVDAGEEMRETRIAFARGIVEAGIAWTIREIGSDKFAKRIGGRWISPGLQIEEAYMRTDRGEVV